MTVLSVIQDATADLSLSTTSTLFGTAYNDNARKLLRHLVRTIKDLAASADWQLLKREQTWTTTATAAQADAIPSDFLRFVPYSMWNRTTTFPIAGPLTSPEWQAHQASSVSRIEDVFYMRADTLYMAPTPPAGETIAFEYITKNIGTDASSTALAAFTADTDIPYFDDELLIAGIVWRYLSAEGQDYSEAFREFEKLKANRWKEDGGSRALDMSGGVVDRRPIKLKIPETLVGLS